MIDECRKKIFCDINGAVPFIKKIEQEGRNPIRAVSVDTLQMNVGKKCNLSCRHCHVNAGPDRKESMPGEVFRKCLEILSTTEISCVDITGGAPEMNPGIEGFIRGVKKLNKKIIVRSNLSIIEDENYKKFIDIYTDNQVEIFTSLPNYDAAKTNKQRGAGVYDKIISVIKILNSRGYAKPDSGLILNLVHNPVGAYLPGSQVEIERQYRDKLSVLHGAAFNSLFCITNMPIGRYLEYLLDSGNYYDYIGELTRAFNPAALNNVMCKTAISVGWDGTLYDCDFNQVLEMPLRCESCSNIMSFDLKKLINREIVVQNHCYGCVAGSGSSCSGAIA